MKTKALNPELITMEDVAEVAKPTTNIAIIVESNPGIVLIDKVKREEFYEHVKREVESFVPDLSTDKGRKAIAALAFKVSRTKTAIDDAGAELKSEWLKQSQVVDESRRDIRYLAWPPDSLPGIHSLPTTFSV